MRFGYRLLFLVLVCVRNALWCVADAALLLQSWPTRPQCCQLTTSLLFSISHIAWPTSTSVSSPHTRTHRNSRFGAVGFLVFVQAKIQEDATLPAICAVCAMLVCYMCYMAWCSAFGPGSIATLFSCQSLLMCRKCYEQEHVACEPHNSTAATPK